VLLVVAALSVALYAGSVDSAFVLDDIRNIVQNPAVRVQELGWEPLRRAAFESPTARPVANLSFALNYRAGGLDGRGYRWVNIAIHALNGMLVFALARASYRRAAALDILPAVLRDPARMRAAAAAAALLFVAHPLQTQAVTYLVQRMTSLATAFYLMALLAFLRGQESPRRLAWWAASAVAFALAVGSKEIAIVLPFALWLYDGCFRRNLDAAWWRWTPLWLVGGAAGLLALALLHPEGLHGFEGRGFTPVERLLTQLRVVWIYAGLVLLPLPSRLNLLHELELSRSLLDPWTTALAGVALVATVAASLRLARRHRFLFFAVAWFGLHLALESSLLPLRMMYEHRLYLPLVGVALAVPVGVAALAGDFRRAIAALGVLVVLLGVGTVVRNRVWRTELSLWSDVVAKSPQSGRAHGELGLALAGAGRWDEALVHFREGVRLDPRHPDRHLHLGNALIQTGHVEEGLAAIARSLALDPEHAPAHQALGMFYLERGRLEQAGAHLERALALRPGAVVRTHLGVLREKQGRLEEARRLYETAIREDPLRAAPHANLGALLARQGEERAAAQHLARAVELDPESDVACNNLAWLLATSSDPALRDPARALALAQTARASSGADDPGILDTLAAAQAAAGRFEEAERTAARAARRAAAAGDTAAAAEIEARRALYARGRSLASPAD
jgi:tetratricopeptide (TPR) repeat protein